MVSGPRTADCMRVIHSPSEHILHLILEELNLVCLWLNSLTVKTVKSDKTKRMCFLSEETRNQRKTLCFNSFCLINIFNFRQNAWQVERVNISNMFYMFCDLELENFSQSGLRTNPPAASICRWYRGNIVSELLKKSFLRTASIYWLVNIISIYNIR